MTQLDQLGIRISRTRDPRVAGRHQTNNRIVERTKEQKTVEGIYIWVSGRMRNEVEHETTFLNNTPH
jgi:hypothetical protein